ncbi:hypothetical protein ABT173_24850 [Streptomyces sp. NPDC001795]|uniref:hypothetical protein n=1 Tax=unclassified Streptomyces TaxID=2593676 RepID=UPI0033203811
MTTDEGDAVHPERLLGAAFEPLVSLSVALILYGAGSASSLRTGAVTCCSPPVR